MKLPTLLSDRQIHSFEYTCEGQSCSAMSTDGRSYMLLSSFSAEERSLAYERGCEMAEQAEDVVLTASTGIQPQYRLWVAVSQEDCQVQNATDEMAEQASSIVEPKATPANDLLVHTSHRDFLKYVKV